MVFLFNDLLLETKPIKKNGVEVFKFKNSYHLVQLQPATFPDNLKGTDILHPFLYFLCACLTLSACLFSVIVDGRIGFSLQASGDTVDVARFFTSSQERDEWFKDLSLLHQDLESKRDHHNGMHSGRTISRLNTYTTHSLCAMQSLSSSEPSSALKRPRSPSLCAIRLGTLHNRMMIQREVTKRVTRKCKPAPRRFLHGMDLIIIRCCAKIPLSVAALH